MALRPTSDVWDALRVPEKDLLRTSAGVQFDLIDRKAPLSSSARPAT
jgi:hypothetical protein